MKEKENQFLDEKNDPHPVVSWDIGSAYDLFISLFVLHHPEKFGLRAPWAAGVRARLTAKERATLEIAQDVIHIPFQWINALKGDKNCENVLWSIKQLAPSERLPSLAFIYQNSKEVMSLLRDIAARRKWTESDLDFFREFHRNNGPENLRNKALIKILETWSNAEEFGEVYLEALQSYHQTFFAEEERQIQSTLEEGLDKAQSQAATLPFNQFIEALTQGVQIVELLHQAELVFTPSYWSTPLIFYRYLTPKKVLVTFGVRPPDVSLIPGEIVPDALLQALKALADPTRLRIMRYLALEPLSPAQLSKRLRLRPPTITHHLAALRLAGLVDLSLEPENERLYSVREKSISLLADQIKDFLKRRG